MNLRISGVLAITAFVVVVCPLGSSQSLAQNAYVTNADSNSVSVIATPTDTVTTTIPVGNRPIGVAVSPDGSKVYVTNSNSVSVIATAENRVTATIPVGAGPFGVAVSPDGSKVYVANADSNSVSVIATAPPNTVTHIAVGSSPIAFGVFIQPRFAGTPGKATCYGQSVSALARTFKGFGPAAADLGYRSVPALEAAIKAFCRG